MSGFAPAPRRMSPEEWTYFDCRRLANYIKGTFQSKYHYSLVTLPTAMPYRMTPFSSFWDYKSRTWVPTEKFGTEGYDYPDFIDFVSESMTAPQILDTAQKWMEEHYPDREASYQQVPTKEGTLFSMAPSSFFWVVSDLGNFSIIPDGRATDPKDQLYVLSMHGMIMS